MKIYINPVYRRIRIASKEAHERIKGRKRVRIQQRVSQTRLADLTQGQVLSFVARVAEARLPVPRLEIIAKFAHLTFHSNIEKHIPVSKFLTSETGVLKPTKPDASSHGDWDSVNNQSRISYCERIKRIRIGTLMPAGLNPTLVALPNASLPLNGSGVNGAAARAESKNDRAILKSANTVRYLSQRSRVNEP